MNKIPFSEDEMKVIGTHVGPKSNGRFSLNLPMLNTPITPKENIDNAWKRKGCQWFPNAMDFLSMESRINKDHVARAEVFDMGPPQTDEEKGGPDMFGVEWVYVPVVGGSMVKPGAPILDDANDWEKIIKFPDLDAMDWEGCAKLNGPFNESKRSFSITFQNGMYERLISFMDFENAIMALIDEDQKDAVHSLFDKLADMYIELIRRFKERFDLNGVVFHDDWGSQRAPFFSLDTCMEMIVPHIKRIVDYCHANGMWFQQHCCGKNEMLVPAMIAEGVDMWMPQPMNNVDMLREKYGDKIMLAVYVPALPETATPEEIDAAAKALVDKYAPGFDEKPLIMVNFTMTKGYNDAIYKYSRMALGK